MRYAFFRSPLYPLLRSAGGDLILKLAAQITKVVALASRTLRSQPPEHATEQARA